MKEKHIEHAQLTKNFKLCDQPYKEVTKLKSKRYELESALRILLHKGKRSMVAKSLVRHVRWLI